MSTLRRAHRKAATELTTISMADKIVAKQEGISELQAAEGLLRLISDAQREDFGENFDALVTIRIIIVLLVTVFLLFSELVKDTL